MENIDYILCECDLAALQNFVTSLESAYTIQLVQPPSICLTMIKAEDSLEHQQFYLGEALTTSSEVMVNDVIGYGICLGDEPVRSYCIAVIDALMQSGGKGVGAINEFLEHQRTLIDQKMTEEYNHILRTKVDFKLMEQE